MFIKPFISTRATPAPPPLSTLIITIIPHIEYCPLHIVCSSCFRCITISFIPVSTVATKGSSVTPLQTQWYLKAVEDRGHNAHHNFNYCAVCSDISVPAASSSLTADGRSIDTKWSFPSWEFSMTILLCGSRAGAGSGHHWASLSPHFKFVNHISGWVAMSSFYFVGMFRKKTIIRPHLTDFERMPG